MAASFYVTGTDTGIGKTVSSSALLHALRARGLRAVGMKPVASGCARDDGGRWVNEDALALQAASDPVPDYADLNPFALPAPLAPELAAQRFGTEVTLAPLRAAFARLRAQAEAVVVEGVGGWAAPLSPTLMQADLVRALGLPVMLVVGLRLGCLNHALLSARAIAGDGLRLAGWIGNTLDPPMDALEENLAMLGQRLPAPCWGVLPWLPGADPLRLAGHLSPP
ncbi:MAG: dethiobiotin synthase [Pseudoxanthomonas sp.]